MPVKAISHSRFNGGASVKRAHGSSTITVYLALTESGRFGDGPGILIAVAGPSASTRRVCALRIAKDLLSGFAPVPEWKELGFMGFDERGKELASLILRKRIDDEQLKIDHFSEQMTSAPGEMWVRYNEMRSVAARALSGYRSMYETINRHIVGY